MFEQAVFRYLQGGKLLDPNFENGGCFFAHIGFVMMVTGGAEFGNLSVCERDMKAFGHDEILS